jgi:hypothetical protein
LELDAASARGLGEGALADVGRQSGARLRVRARDGEAAVEALRLVPGGGGAPLELDLEWLDPLPAELAGRVRRAAVRREADLAAAVALAGVELEVRLTREAEALARRATEAAPDWTVLTFPGRARLSEVLSLDPSPEALAGIGAAVRAEGLPPCVAPGAAPARAVLDAVTLRPGGGIDLLPWAEAWVERDFRTRSLRCARCADAERCPGAHVNYVRAFGFGWMRARG